MALQPGAVGLLIDKVLVLARTLCDTHLGVTIPKHRPCRTTQGGGASETELYKFVDARGLV